MYLDREHRMWAALPIRNAMRQLELAMSNSYCHENSASHAHLVLSRDRASVGQ
jgi:hypothetical protein